MIGLTTSATKKKRRPTNTITANTNRIKRKKGHMKRTTMKKYTRKTRKLTNTSKMNITKKKEKQTNTNTTCNKKIHDQNYYKKTKAKKEGKRCAHMGAARIALFDDNAISQHTVGNMEYTCGKCLALMFKDEQHKYIDKLSNTLCYSLCCSYGSPLKFPP